MYKKFVSTLAVSLMLAGCGGGGGSTGSPVPFDPTGSTTGPQSSTLPAGAAAIATANSVGTTLQSFTSFEQQQFASQALQTALRPMGKGTPCTNGVIVTTPDRNGDPNSTEVQDFYDPACTYIARDTVRKFVENGTSELETLTQNQYSYSPSTKNPKPIAVRNDVVNLQNATFDAAGYPVATDGYLRSSTGALAIGSTKVIVSDFDLVMQPAQKGMNTYCSDSAGFSIDVVDTVDGLQFQSYGWAAVVATGTRMRNSDGSVTWNGTHEGHDYSGPAGSITLSFAAPNTTCPINSPMFSVHGPNDLGTRTLPISVTYLSGVIKNLTITNAQLGNNITLNVTTNSSVGPGSSEFINGVLSGPKGAVIASFNVNAFGDGTLTQQFGGNNQYAITDWHVMHNAPLP